MLSSSNFQLRLFLMSTKSYLKSRTIRGTPQKWVGFGKPLLPRPTYHLRIWVILVDNTTYSVSGSSTKFPLPSCYLHRLHQLFYTSELNCDFSGLYCLVRPFLHGQGVKGKGKVNILYPMQRGSTAAFLPSVLMKEKCECQVGVSRK